MATRIILDVYQFKGDPVRSFLPPDNDNTRKNVLYKQIFEGFDRIDATGGGGGAGTARSQPGPNSKVTSLTAAFAVSYGKNSGNAGAILILLSYRSLD